MEDEKKEKVIDDVGIKLKQEPFPSNVNNVTSFIDISTNKEQTKEQTILSSNHEDRRKKFDELLMFITKDCNKIDITKYILRLTIQFGADKFYVGTGTIIRIVQNTLYILTCAHNIITFHPYKNETYYANNIWLRFEDKEISATKFYIYPGYTKKYRLGNDLAMIECKIVKPFMFYQIFPILTSLQSCNYNLEKTTKQNDWNMNINADATSVSMWMLKSITSVAYNAVVKQSNDNEVENKNKNRNKNKNKNKNKNTMSVHNKGEIYGYPGEKNGELWGMKGDIVVLDEEYLISYSNIDTTGGQSGGPIFVNGEIVGIHTNGDYLGVKENYGSMLTFDRIQWIYNLIPCQVGIHPKYFKNKK